MVQGSLLPAGSFFDVDDLPAGSYEVGPPYTEEVPVFFSGETTGKVAVVCQLGNC